MTQLVTVSARRDSHDDAGKGSAEFPKATALYERKLLEIQPLR